MDVEYASKGKGNAALTTGIIGTAGYGLNLLSNLMGNNCANRTGCGHDDSVNRYELNMQNEITNRDMEIAYLRSRDASKTDDLEMFKYFDGRIKSIETQVAQQAVVNAQITANISCMQNTLNVLSGLTKTTIPIENICPAPMARYNTWTAPTDTATTAPAA